MIAPLTTSEGGRSMMGERSNMNRTMILALLVGGCSSAGGGGGPADFAMPADLAMAPDLRPAYPPEPYGPNIDDTLPNFTFQGYWDPTDTTGLSRVNSMFGEVRMDMVYNQPGLKCGLMFFGGFT
jgi:hypothetical protein